MSLTFTSNADKVMPEFVAEASRWLNNTIYKVFGDLSPMLIDSAKIFLTKDQVIASKSHINNLKVTVKEIGKSKYGLYLYSTVPYDLTILTGEPFVLPTIGELYFWISSKINLGIWGWKGRGEPNIMSQAQSIQSRMRARGAYRGLPYDYVGLVVNDNSQMIIDTFNKELESGR